MDKHHLNHSQMRLNKSYTNIVVYTECMCVSVYCQFFLYAQNKIPPYFAVYMYAKSVSVHMSGLFTCSTHAIALLSVF